MKGPGKYDAQCTAARDATGARAVVLIVIDGAHGNGFSVQADSASFDATLPALLRTLANIVEQESRA